MDSGSGGSLPSSSGADEDYDSHHHHQPQLFPPPPPPLFFNNNNHIPSPQPLPFDHLSHHNYQNHFHPTTTNTNFYDLPSNYNFNLDSSTNSFFNPTSLRSPPPTAALDGSTQIPTRPSSSSSGVLHPKVATKKRTRASRRAPTTVLTTDTTNFRAMVQEFTGIPSPPFTASGSSYSSRRFDLFGSINLEASGSGLFPSRSKVQLAAVAVEDQNVSNLQQQQAQAGIFSFQSLSEETHLEQQQQPPHIHGSSSSQQLLSAALQNDEAWRNNGGGTASTAIATAATVTATATRSNNNNNNNNAGAGNCKLKFTGSSSSSNHLQREKEILLGNIITSRGENTVDSWIYPSD